MQVTYPVNGATVSGELLRPPGEGPFPAVVLNHGYIEPVDLRHRPRHGARAGLAGPGTGSSCCTPTTAATPPATRSADLDRELRLAYTRDAIAAVLALERAALRRRRPDWRWSAARWAAASPKRARRRARPGRRRGDLRRVSSHFLDNLRRWTIPERPTRRRRRSSSGSARRERNPAFYRELSARTYFDRINVPVLIAPRRRRRQLPDGLVAQHPAAAARGRGRQPAGHLPRRGPHLLPALGGLDPAHRPVPEARSSTCDRVTNAGASFAAWRAASCRPAGWTRSAPGRAFVERGDEAEQLVRPEILTSWTRSEAALSPDVTEAPLADESETAAYWRGLPAADRGRAGRGGAAAYRRGRRPRRRRHRPRDPDPVDLRRPGDAPQGRVGELRGRRALGRRVGRHQRARPGQPASPRRRWSSAPSTTRRSCTTGCAGRRRCTTRSPAPSSASSTSRRPGTAPTRSGWRPRG